MSINEHSEVLYSEIYDENLNKDLEVAFLERKTHIGSSNFPSICINILKSILGTGLLALPYTFSILGPLLAIPLLFLFGYFSFAGLRIYSLCGMRAGVQNIGSICRMIDWRLQVAVDLALFIMCIGTAISYFTIIGDFMPDLMKFQSLHLNRNIFIAFSGLLLLPLGFVRNTQKFRYSSILGMIGILFVLFLSIRLLFTNGIYSGSIPLINYSPEGFKQLNVIVFVFTCHQNLLHIKSDSIDQSENFISSAVKICLIISGFIYLIFSLASYLVFGVDIDPNILNNYSNGILSDLSKWFYVAMAIFSFPLLIPPAKSAITNLSPIHLSQSTCTISAWIGVLAGVPICYLLPCYLHYKYFKDDLIGDKNFKTNSVISITMCFTGLLLIVTFMVL